MADNEKESRVPTFRRFGKALVSSAWGRATIATIVFGAMTLVFAHVVWSSREGRKLMAEVRRLQSLGEPLSLVDCAPAPLPPEENAVDIYQRAIDLAKAVEDEFEEDFSDQQHRVWKEIRGRRIHKLSEPERELLREMVSSDKAVEALELAQKALSKPRCQFDLKYEDGFSMSLAHLSGFRKLARLINYQMMLDGAEGDLQAALDRLPAAVHAARAMEEESLIISGLVKVACEGTCERTVQCLLREHEPTAEQLRSVERTFRPTGRSSTYADMLRWERAAGAEICLAMCFRGLSKENRELLESTGCFKGNPFGWFGVTVLLKPVTRKATLHYLRFMERSIEAASTPAPKGWQETQAVNKQLEMEIAARKKGLMRFAFWPADLLMPALGRAHGMMLRGGACRDSLRIAAAMKAYKLEKGDWPKLDDLVPDYLPDIPKDPFTGRDYVVSRKDGLLTVYSVGEDGTDDGGVIMLEKGQPPDAGAAIGE